MIVSKKKSPTCKSQIGDAKIEKVQKFNKVTENVTLNSEGALGWQMMPSKN